MRLMGYREIAAAFTTAPLNEIRKMPGGAAKRSRHALVPTNASCTSRMMAGFFGGRAV
jgi:hypothetical protein